jgi:CRP/FNR family cyclic AMP-dependent transcriptional regulator
MLRRFTHRPPARAPLGLDSQQFKLRLLSEADIFRGLSPEDLREIGRMTTMTTARKGRILYEPDSSREVLFILKKGRVQLSRVAEDGRRLVTAILEAGAVFGEMELLSQRMGGGTAEALEDSTLCAMSRNDLERLIITKPRVALNVLQLLASRNAELEERLERQAFQSVHERLAAILLKLAGDGHEIRNVSHQQIGEAIGASRETVTRALGDFRARGLVDLSRSRITILNQRALEEATRT